VSVAPNVRYARRGDMDVAYAVIGDGPIDVVFVPCGCRKLSRAADQVVRDCQTGQPAGAT